MQKAFFFDIDGTLIDFGMDMSESTAAALTQARAAGHKVVICTGRSRFQIPENLLACADGLVASTGALVLDGERVVCQHSMPAETTRRVLDCFSGTNAYLNFQAESRMVMEPSAYDRSMARFHALKRPQSIIDRLMKNARMVESFEDYHDVKKANYFDSPYSLEQLREKLGDVCDVVPLSFYSANGTNGEITCRGINKSFGMAQYLQAVGIDREDSVAFGDSDNDLDMLEYAGIGIAMGNAIPALKEKADYVTTSVNQDGIYHALVHFGWI